MQQVEEDSIKEELDIFLASAMIDSRLTSSLIRLAAEIRDS